VTGAVTPAFAGEALAVEDRLQRANAGLRVVVLADALALTAYRWESFTRPWLAVLTCVVMVAWTTFAIYAFRGPRLRTTGLLVLDLAMAMLAMGVTPFAKTPSFNATLPGFWVMGALMAWAIHWRVLGGLVASAGLALLDLLLRDHWHQSTFGNVFLILIGGPIVGFVCAQLTRLSIERAVAERAAAEATERARLARAVHDGVLQVLALVQRRGRGAGGDLGELARLAGDQERALRSLIRQQDTLSDGRVGGDLAIALEELTRTRGATLTVPGGPVPLPPATVAELTGAVGACLDNVAVHVGEDAPAWVMVQDLGDSVSVTVRDEGPGIPEGRLVEASAAGRLGVSGSIRGRLVDLGGEARLTSSSFGTEWELVVPRENAS
jgi:signal transduction histidine kinase